MWFGMSSKMCLYICIKETRNYQLMSVEGIHEMSSLLVCWGVVGKHIHRPSCLEESVMLPACVRLNVNATRYSKKNNYSRNYSSKSSRMFVGSLFIILVLEIWRKIRSLFDQSHICTLVWMPNLKFKSWTPLTHIAYHGMSMKSANTQKILIKI